VARKCLEVRVEVIILDLCLENVVLFLKFRMAIIRLLHPVKRYEGRQPISPPSSPGFHILPHKDPKFS
jgi:hypothetical protein